MATLRQMRDRPPLHAVDSMVSTLVIEPEEIIAAAEPDLDEPLSTSEVRDLEQIAHDETPIVPADIPDAVAEPGIPYNAVTGANYTGKNVMRLIMAEAQHGYGAGGWAGFHQWRQVGRTVKRDEHGTGLIRMGAETVKHEDGTTSVGKVRPFGARVFHFDQTTELVPAEDGGVMKRETVTLVIEYDENDVDAPHLWDWCALTGEITFVHEYEIDETATSS